MMGRYRKKPVVIEAIQYLGTSDSAGEVTRFAGGHTVLRKVREEFGDIRDYDLTIPTLEGDHVASPGDWIIKGVKGEFYPCKPDIFEVTYSPELVGGAQGMTFGQAVEVMRAGGRVARSGWNGKGMWVAMTPGSVIPNEFARSGACLLLAKDRPGDIQINPHLDMKAADGTIVVGWLASQTDVAATDWQIVE